MAGDWLDNVDVSQPAQKTQGGDWLDNVDVTPPAPGRSILPDWAVKALPDWASGPFSLSADPNSAGGTAARAGIRAGAGLLDAGIALPQALAGQLDSWGIGHPAGSFYEAQTDQPPMPGTYYDAPQDRPVAKPALPSEQAIGALGLTPDLSKMSAGQRAAESVLPWLMPNANMASRIGEAPGLINKGMTALRSVAGGAADWAASDAAQEYAQEHGWGPAAQTLAGMLGTQARPAVGHGLSVARTGSKEAPGFYDDNRKIDATPPIGDVAGTALRTIAEGLNAFPLNGTGINAATAAQKAAIAHTYDKGVHAVDAGAPSIEEGSAAGSLNTYSEGVATRARAKLVQDRQDAAAESNRLETPIESNQVDTKPVRDALTAIINGNDGIDVKDAARARLDELDRDDPFGGGTMSFAAMKQARESMGDRINRQFPAQTGVSTTAREVGRTLGPVKDAMSEALGGAADRAGVGPAWRANDAKWRQNAAELQNLGPFAGELLHQGGDIDPATGQPTPPSWNSTASSGDVASKLKEAVKGNMPLIDRLNAGMPGEGDSALAQVLASQGTPQTGGQSGLFRPDRLAVDFKTNVGDQAKAHIAAGPGGPEAVENLQNAADAAKSTVRGKEPGGLGKMLAGLAIAAVHGGSWGTAGGALAGPVGAAVGALGHHIIANSLTDPSLARLVSGRRMTSDNVAGLLSQYAQRAGLSATSPVTPIMPAVNAVRSSLPGWAALGSGLKRLSPY